MDKSKKLISQWVLRAVLLLFLGLLLNVVVFTTNNRFDRYLTNLTGDLVYGLVSSVDNNYRIDFGGLNGLNTNGCRVSCGNVAWVSIGDQCNGRDILLLYVGFLFSVPSVSIKRKFIFSLIGVFCIFLSNIIRIVLLLFLASDLPHLFELMHKYIFQILMYGILFLFWNEFLKKIRIE